MALHPHWRRGRGPQRMPRPVRINATHGHAGSRAAGPSVLFCGGACLAASNSSIRVRVQGTPSASGLLAWFFKPTWVYTLTPLFAG